MDLERRNRVALARELTYAAGVPLRDRYGYAASDETVLRVLNIICACPDDDAATQAIGLANARGVIELAMGWDVPTDEAYERQVVQTLRPLVEWRRDAAVQALGEHSPLTWGFGGEHPV